MAPNLSVNLTRYDRRRKGRIAMSLFTRLARLVAPQQVLNWQAKHDPLTRDLVVAVNLVFYSEDDPQDQINQYVRSRTPDLRAGMTAYLLSRIENVSNASNRPQACRKWVLDEAFEYAPIRALFQSAADYSLDISQGRRHPAALGLWEVAPQIVPLVLTERLKKHGTAEAVLSDMRLESIWHHTKLHFANIARLSLGDRTLASGVEWYQPLFNALVARAELVVRERIGAPDEAAKPTVDRELAELLDALDLTQYNKLSSIRTTILQATR